MGKQARQTQHESKRAAAATAAIRERRRRRQRPYWIGIGVVVLLAAVAILVSIASHGATNGLPKGTVVFVETNHSHVVGAVHYDHTPPAGGPHSAQWLNCGVYSRPVPNENAVHDLEHGAVWITYRPDLSQLGIAELVQFAVNHYDGAQRYITLSPYPGLPAPVVASVWGAQIRLNGPNDPRLAAFVAHYIGGNQGGEQGAPCTGGVGTPSA